ncbi:hypothetical protein E2C01_079740 [Portunus trituberculatus]|uniref:Uncharacterized protein n=1 Tax=Portunus trituberculatus TaxID=210409 RepID=A0A5B7IRD9_PORTR|nr:hypothetical protein [Portunus trituberculatus]
MAEQTHPTSTLPHPPTTP